MSLETVFFVGIAVVLGGGLLLIGAVMLIRGLSSARNAYVALLGDDTVLADVDGDEDTATVKLSGTIEDVPDPVETAEGREAGVYHLKAVAKNWRNMLSKRNDVKWLLAEGARLEQAVVDDDGDRFELTADPIDENRKWGGVQEDSARGWGSALKRPDVATGEWTRKEKYTGDDGVPDDLAGYLESEYDADVDVDVSATLVSLTVGETVIGAGDTIRLVGKVQPEQAAATTQEQAAVADGGRPPVSLNLTPGATLTGGSWRTLAWTETKSAVKAPAGLLFVVMGITAPLIIFAQLGFISLGLGL